MNNQLHITSRCGSDHYDIVTDKQTAGHKYSSLPDDEFKNKLIELATKNAGKEDILNASSDNPNFFSTLPRTAFSLLNTICTEIGNEECPFEDIGYIPVKKGIAKQFDKQLWKHRASTEGKFLKEIVHKMKRLNSDMSKDEFIHDLVVSTIGCFYPNPSRIQNFAEPVLTKFLQEIVYRPNKVFGRVSLMPTEGVASAVVNILNSLKYNNVVVPGDTIAVMTPVFSQYLDIPLLENYSLKQVCIKADFENNWEVPEEEILKLADENVKALLLVNPTNPTGLSLSSNVVKNIRSVVKKNNPNLIIISDNAYAPFAEEFNSLFNALPSNTIGIFSFSRYFGVTGWRLGIVAIHDSNIIDRKLLKNSTVDINYRYKLLSSRPEKIKFIDRIMLDTRQVALSYASGLSTPQQVLMCLFAMHDLDDKKGVYDQNLQDILTKRMKDVLSPLNNGLLNEHIHEANHDPLKTNYYVVLNIPNVVNDLVGGTDFGTYLYEHRDPYEFLLRLSKNYATVLSPGVIFGAPFWSVRISLASLPDEDYTFVGNNIRSLIDEYYIEFRKWLNKQSLLNQEQS